jgi:hypothetical protein
MARAEIGEENRLAMKATDRTIVKNGNYDFDSAEANQSATPRENRQRIRMSLSNGE